MRRFDGMNRSDSLETWIDRQYGFSAKAILESVSPVGIVKTRPGFGQTIVPKRGSIIASPVLADWNPDPDYFFHWFRDSAIVIDAMRVLHEDGTLGAEALTHVLEGDIDFVLRDGDEPDFDMWEEERGQNYYSLRVGATALERACTWLLVRDGAKATACSTKASVLHQRLDSFWMEGQGF